MGLVDLRIFDKLEAAVIDVVDGDPSDYLEWAEVPPYRWWRWYDVDKYSEK